MATYKIIMRDCDANVKIAIKAYRKTMSSPIGFKKVVSHCGQQCIELTFTDIEFYSSIVKLGFIGTLNIENLTLSEAQSPLYDGNKDYTVEPTQGAWCEKPILNSVDGSPSPNEKQPLQLAARVEEHLQRFRQYSPDESKIQIAYKILEEFQTALLHIQKYLDEGLNQEIIHKQIVDKF